ncbi:putative oxidoreductase [Streptomyces bingchenggensis BCW-1]|uniref:Putative oxidoreductase n=1 Tax=Streptomyces bingchenggensis (strain BCW-1) TaxID=749414 RepID=D7BYM6_STRBB|nr:MULTISPECIES: FAD-binding protein [Streptomyces]ADI03554.1 putative oxidoreductase [Streptomyces bingchenggensis BCW-1]
MTGTTRSPAASVTAEALVRALRREVPSLRVDTSGGRRALCAYDASNYRVPLLAVAFPADADEVAGAHKVCHRLGVPVTSRGAGTSMAGNAVGAGLVLDLSRHLRRVLLLVDSFPQAFRPELAGAASRVLAEAGLPTRARGDICCGLTWITTHCQQYAVFGAGQQRELLRDLGIEKITEATGCCGVAGNFGFERDHYDVSLAVADQALRPRPEAAGPGTPVLADGFSCQMQIEHLVGDDRPGATHLAQLLDDPQP